MANMWVDSETNQRLNALAKQMGRTKIETLRRLLDNSLDSLPPFDQAVLWQVAKDEGQDSLVEAVSYVIRDWQRMKQVTFSSPPHNSAAPAS